MQFRGITFYSLCAYLCLAIMAAGMLPLSAASALANDWQVPGKACLPIKDRMFPSFNWDTGEPFSSSRMPACHCAPKSYCPDSLSEWSTHPRMPVDQAGICCPGPRECDVNITTINSAVSDGNDNRADSDIVTRNSRTSRTVHSFCHSFSAIPVTAQTIPLRRGEPGTGDSEAYSYAQTCRSAHINSNDKMAAQCLKTNGEYVRATIDNVSECTSIHNNNGELACSRNSDEKALRERGAEQLNSCMSSCKASTDRLHSRAPNNPGNLALMNQIGACEQSCRLQTAQLFGYRSGSQINGQTPAFTSVPFTATGPVPATAITLLDSKLSCNQQEDIGFCETVIQEVITQWAIRDCVAAGSLITMVDGSTKPIEQILAGDQVKGYNSINTVSGSTRNFTISEKIYSINDGQLLLTEGHPILTKDGWKAVNPDLIGGKLRSKVSALKEGDILIHDTSEPVTITSLTPVEGNTSTDRHNLSVDGDGTFIANGLILRGFNLSIQY